MEIKVYDSHDQILDQDFGVSPIDTVPSQHDQEGFLSKFIGKKLEQLSLSSTPA